METIIEREYYPSGDKLLLIKRFDGYYCVEQQVGNEKQLLLCCTGECALSASVDFYEKRYNLIKHVLYPNYCPEHLFEEYKKANYELYESIKKKYIHIKDEPIYTMTCITEYHQCNHY